ncbi:putative serine/threonine-protein kinase GCN2 [Aphelenchoides fujianensis]|nr:putative serine/threonine-protein kinase GCN2 [Aphelenchoides fujianensis]
MPDGFFVDKIRFSSMFREFSKLILSRTAAACNLLLSNPLTPQHPIRNAIKLSEFDIVSNIVGSRYKEEFEEFERIGSGGFGSVFKVRSRIDRQFYAIKKIPLPSADIEFVEKAVQECRHHASLESRHIVRYHASSHGGLSNSGDPPPVYKITSDSDSMIRFSDGSGRSSEEKQTVIHKDSRPIISFLSTDSDDSEEESSPLQAGDEGGSSGNSSDVSSEDCKIVALNRPKRYSHTTNVGNEWKLDKNPKGPIPVLFIQMELAVASLETFMLQRDHQPNARIDFEFNSRCRRERRRRDDFLVNPFPPRCRRTRGIGTILYAAPEQLASTDYDLSADVFSTGVVFYELFHVFHSRMERVHTLRQLRTHGISSEFMTEHPQIGGLIERMIVKRPADRPTAREALSACHAMKEADENTRLRQQVDALKAQNRRLVAEAREWKAKFEQLLRLSSPPNGSGS